MVNKKLAGFGIVAIIAIGGILLVSTGMWLLTTEGVGTFHDNGKDIELEDGKPVVRLFSTTWCPHCIWVGPAFEEVVAEYDGRIVARHWEVNIGDDTLTAEYEGKIPNEEGDVFLQANPSGGVPTFVFGGKYVRVGTAFEREDDLEKEKEDFRKVIDSLLAQAKE